MRNDIETGYLYGEEVFPNLFTSDNTARFTFTPLEIRSLRLGQLLCYRWASIKGNLETGGPMDKVFIQSLSGHFTHEWWTNGFVDERPTRPIMETDNSGEDLYLYFDPDNPESFDTEITLEDEVVAEHYSRYGVTKFIIKVAGVEKL